MEECSGMSANEHVQTEYLVPVFLLKHALFPIVGEKRREQRCRTRLSICPWLQQINLLVEFEFSFV